MGKAAVLTIQVAELSKASESKPHLTLHSSSGMFYLVNFISPMLMRCPY